MTLSKTILKNPLLTNPNKWLKNVPKKHSSNLLQNHCYNRDDLDTNPFVQSLIKTDSNSIDTVLPEGNGIRLSVTTGEDDKHEEKFNPHLFTCNGPSRLISNNEKYIQSLNTTPKLANAYRPFQAERINLSKGKNISIENLHQDIDKLYKDTIEKHLKTYTNGEGEGIQLSGNATRWNSSRLNVDKSLFNYEEDVFISFKENPILTQLIVKYMDYKGL
ncbi:uncharacterized protein KGF55_004517 [Candida pseudojiufengensis]|uniref:uncharacterized protein n=1 Tax=Candida pseudojiufengensis TaxID=497109 RepID=UPI002224C366|nr:uncharacterized protein KGF55_004517 [Candida pseudojiufengensis]KAI5960624.1 hypothetical protein KGF55_004517 [Candida pseudojiufengensis]